MMHAPSALLAGVVLTFGVTALANLYLPSAATVAQRAVSVSVVESAPISFADEPTVYAEPVETSVPTVEVPEPQAAVAAPDDVVQSEPEPAVVAERPAPKSVEEPKKIVAKAAPVKKKEPAPKPKPKPAASESKEEAPAAPAQFAAAASSPVFGKAVPAKQASDPNSVTVSAVSGDRAWVRIGDTRTLAVKPGDQVANLGRVKSIAADSVTFENGLTLKVAL